MNNIIEYDFHSHILPGIDDGAKDIEESLSLLDAIKNQGIKHICLTPHFYTNQESTEDFLTKRDASFKLLQSNYVNTSDISFHLGAEVFLTDYFFNYSINNKLCIDSNKYLLCEFSYDTDFSGKHLQYIYRILSYQYVPIIAHIERYPKLLKDKKKQQELIDLGVIFQSNFVSFTDKSLKKKLIKLLVEDKISLLGSDVHSLHRNPPESISQAQDFISSKLSNEYLDKINKNSQII